MAALLCLATPALGTSERTAVEISYGSGAEARGKLDVRCDGFAVLDGIATSVAVEGVVLERFETRWNETWVRDPQNHDIRVKRGDHEQTVERERLEDGTYSVEAASGMVRLLSADWPDSGGRDSAAGLGIQMIGKEMLMGPARWNPLAGSVFIEDPATSAVVSAYAGMAAWHRIVEATNATAFVGGEAAALLMKNVSLLGPDGALAYDSASEKRAAHPRTGVVSHYEFVERHAILRAASLDWVEENATARYACGSMQWEVSGSFTFLEAEGTIGPAEFVERVATIQGTLVTNETLDAPQAGDVSFLPVYTYGGGDVRAAFLDFHPNEVTPSAASEHMLSAGAAAGALLLLGGWWFYTRRTRQVALDNPTRSELYDIVRARPWIRESTLANVVAVGLTTVRYHLDRLAKAGVVVRRKIAGAVRYSANGDTGQPELAAKHPDPAVRLIKDEMGSRCFPQPEAVELLMTKLGYARSGAYNRLRRLQEEGHLDEIPSLGKRRWFVCGE